MNKATLNLLLSLKLHYLSNNITLCFVYFYVIVHVMFAYIRIPRLPSVYILATWRIQLLMQNLSFLPRYAGTQVAPPTEVQGAEPPAEVWRQSPQLEGGLEGLSPPSCRPVFRFLPHVLDTQAPLE